jgi:hypothetical protein
VSLLAQMQDGVQIVGAARLRALVDESVAPAA